jgi:hypothetical protein
MYCRQRFGGRIVAVTPAASHAVAKANQDDLDRCVEVGATAPGGNSHIDGIGKGAGERDHEHTENGYDDE